MRQPASPLLLLLTLAGCGATCGAGTTEVDGVCVADDDTPGDGGSADGGSDSGDGGSDSGDGGGSDSGDGGGSGGSGDSGGDSGGDGGDTGGDGGAGVTLTVDDLVAGDLVFTEIMADPTDCLDNEGEYIELRNTTSATVDLDGLQITDNSATITISGTTLVAPGGLALGTRTDGSCYGLVGDFSFGLALDNSGDSLTAANSAAAIDAVDFTAFGVRAGASLSLDAGSEDAASNDAASAWCAGTEVFAGATDDLGTPGTDNAACPADAEAGTAIFTSAAGVVTDLSTELGAGTASAAATWSSSEAGTLDFGAGTWYVSLEFGADSAVAGAGDGLTVLSGGGNATVLTVTGDRRSFTLSGLTVRDGLGTNGGGLAITGTDGDITLADCSFEGNTAVNGGAVYQAYGALSISGCDFTDNTATSSGGAIYVTADAYETFHFALSDGTLSANGASNGGALFLYQNTAATIDGATLDSNRATYGGAIYGYWMSAALTDATISENSAAYGGGVYGAQWASFDFACPTSGGVTTNTASVLGGGVYNMYSGGVSSDSCDWGTDKTENSPDDWYCAWYGYGLSSWGAGTTDAVGC